MNSRKISAFLVYSVFLSIFSLAMATTISAEDKYPKIDFSLSLRERLEIWNGMNAKI
jgi:hypothetical protein